MIVPQLILSKLKLEFLKSDCKSKKKDKTQTKIIFSIIQVQLFSRLAQVCF